MQALPPAPAQRRAQGTAYPTAAAWTRALARMPRRRVRPLHRHRRRAPRTASPTAVALTAIARTERYNIGPEGGLDLSRAARVIRRMPRGQHRHSRHTHHPGLSAGVLTFASTLCFGALVPAMSAFGRSSPFCWVHAGDIRRRRETDPLPTFPVRCQFSLHSHRLYDAARTRGRPSPEIS